MTKLLSEQQASEVQKMMLADRLVKIDFGEGKDAILVHEQIGSGCETVALIVSPGVQHDLYDRLRPEWYSGYEHFLIAYGLSTDGLPIRN